MEVLEDEKARRRWALDIQEGRPLQLLVPLLSAKATAKLESMGVEVRLDTAVVEGALAWMFADPSYPDFDGYTLYPGGGRPTAEAERQSVGGGKVWPDGESLAGVAEYGRGGRAVAPS